MINRLAKNASVILKANEACFMKMARFDTKLDSSFGIHSALSRKFGNRPEKLQPNPHYLRRLRVEAKKAERAEDKVHLRFKSLGIGEELEKYLEKLEVHTPTPIQARIIPTMLKESKKSLFVGAQTGSGKTLAYLLPIFEELKRQEKELGLPKGATLSMRPKVLIICPSKELVHQVALVAKDIGHHCRLKVTKLCNDQEFKRETEKLIEGVDIVVGTFRR